jgi:ribulose-5-phosphate 4-epimerase/fuculose-1-phosphate aldolase
LLAQACHVLYHQGHEHFFLGHVSARAPTAGQVWVKPTGFGLEEVGPEHMLLADLDGNKLEGEWNLHTEMPIHTAIYKARPDVNAVVHTHAFHAAGLSASRASFQMVSQDSILVGEVPCYPSAELVESAALGAALASALGDSRAILMKNHGLTAVGSSIEQAVVRAVSLERSCRTQLAAAQLGGVVPIAPEELGRMSARLGANQAREQAIWRYLVRACGRG